MFNPLAALVGGMLVWAAALKFFGRNAKIAARRSGLSRVVGTNRALAAYRAVGGVELVIGVLLVAPPVRAAEGWAAAVLSAGMLGYLGYIRLVAPESSCGCLGAKHAPVRWRGFARAGVLLAASVGAALSVSAWDVLLLAGGAVLVFTLSPELDSWWLVPLRRLRLRYRHPLAGRGFEVPLESTVQQLEKSDAYRSVVELLRSDVLEHWDEGEWRLLTYSARRESGPATAVFAVPRLRYSPDLVRVALVDDELVTV